jgi:hypothetical protein
MLNRIKYIIMKTISITKQQSIKKTLIPITIANAKRTQWNNSRRYDY